MPASRKATEQVLGPVVTITNASIDMVTDDTEVNTPNHFAFLKITAINTYYLWRPIADLPVLQAATEIDGSFTLGNQLKQRTNGGALNYSFLNNGFNAHN